ncbi:unnamed protein product, partial [Rotaria sordida]
INWPVRHLFKQINRWNHFDENIKLSENIGSTADFLDLHIENQDGQLFTTIFQKPSYEPYYLPFNSIHPLHMKKNIIFTMFLRTIRYCSTFQAYLNERERLRMALLLNKYPNRIIDKQFNHVLSKFSINKPLDIKNYNLIRQEIIQIPIKEKIPVDYGKKMFIHFTYCCSMKTFPKKFHALWDKYFGESPINEVLPVLGTRNVKNLQRQLTYKISVTWSGRLITMAGHCTTRRTTRTAVIATAGHCTTRRTTRTAVTATAGHCTTRRTKRTAVVATAGHCTTRRITRTAAITLSYILC